MPLGREVWRKLGKYERVRILLRFRYVQDAFNLIDKVLWRFICGFSGFLDITGVPSSFHSWVCVEVLCYQKIEIQQLEDLVQTLCRPCVRSFIGFYFELFEFAEKKVLYIILESPQYLLLFIHFRFPCA